MSKTCREVTFIAWLCIGLAAPQIQAGTSQLGANRSQTATGRAVTVREIPSTWALVRDVRGDYSKHPEAFRELMQYVGSNYRAVGDCFGIYPMDPDAVKQASLAWQVGVRITPGKPLGYGKRVELNDFAVRSERDLARDRKRLKETMAPYRIILLAGTPAAVLESSVAEAPKDGLSVFRWMAENGFVQVAATRMEYLSHEGAPNKIHTRIIVPVQKRASGLAVPTANRKQLEIGEYEVASMKSQETRNGSRNEIESFSFVVGDWSGTFKAHPTARIPKMMEAPAVMKSRWGPQHAWIESEANTEIPGIGSYSAKVIVHFDLRTSTFDSFVVNTFGNAARYAGRLEGNKVVFVGKVGDVTQRVTYENVSGTELKFLVEESHNDGASYQPHSEILWTRR